MLPALFGVGDTAMSDAYTRPALTELTLREWVTGNKQLNVMCKGS